MSTQAPSDLEAAIKESRQAVNDTPDDNLSQARYKHDLAAQLSLRWLETKVTGDLEECIALWHTILHQSNSHIIDRIRAGISIVRLDPDWTRAYQAAAFAISLVPKLMVRSLENSDRQHVLRRLVGLASDAAASAIRIDEKPIIALSLLEQSRGVLGASLEELRTDILDLKRSHPDLAHSFSCLRDELESSPTLDTATADQGASSWKAQESRRHQVGKDLDQLLVQIRTLPGFKDFLFPPNEAEIHNAAKSGPIAIINVSYLRNDAILVWKNQVQTLPLTRLTMSDIREHSNSNRPGSPQVLEWLWDTVAHPVLEALGFSETPLDDDWPRLWWIPTGPLSKFPLHAAGYHSNRSSESVIDRVVSSYSSSVKTIINNRRLGIQTSTSGQAIFVAVENTPGLRPLAFVQEEVTIAQRLCKSMMLKTVQLGVKEEVVQSLRDCIVFHFAGHGHTDGGDPLNSYLCLVNEDSNQTSPLTVADLLNMNLREFSPFLAYLSACGTGQMKDIKAVDESIHIISGCQLAGFRHVIGTLWEVDDRFCVDMARITYQKMRGGGMTDVSVCRALHEATRQLRDSWLKAQEKVERGKPSLVAAMDLTSVQIGNESKRNVSLVSDEDERNWGLGPSYWVPYVHYGV